MDRNKLPHYLAAEHGLSSWGASACQRRGLFSSGRTNRTHPEWDDGIGGTYKHGTDLTFWNNIFYLYYFTNPMSEHTDVGKASLLLQTTACTGTDFALSSHRIRSRRVQ